MSGIIEGVDQRTRLVGRNRLELLMFGLGSAQRFGINVFKVREVIRCPALTRIPNANSHVRGLARLRGLTIPVIDLAAAVGGTPAREGDEGFVIVSEFNRHVQGFLVAGVERIVNLNWDAIRHPPVGGGIARYLTAVTEVDGALVEILDVEKVFAEIIGVNIDVGSDAIEEGAAAGAPESGRVLVVDDSLVAQRQIARTLDQIGFAYEVAGDGAAALELLTHLDRSGTDVARHFDAVISDVEMPRMDGYTLTKSIRADESLASLPVILHTSLSGVFNQAMVERAGADEFVPKFDADELARVVLRMLAERAGATPAA